MASCACGLGLPRVSRLSRSPFPTTTQYGRAIEVKSRPKIGEESQAAVTDRELVANPATKNELQLQSRPDPAFSTIQLQ
jgi:hypothetical protein